MPHLAFQPDRRRRASVADVDDTVTSYYFRMRVADQPGVLADITRILADGRISIDALFQREPSEGENQTDIIMLTHDAVERDVNAAIRRIEAAADGAGAGDPRSARKNCCKAMRYLSTRGKRAGAAFPRHPAFWAWRSDGGLYVPASYPQVTRDRA